MKSMKNILAEFREYSQKVNSLQKIIESREAKKKQLAEDREVLDEISREAADRIYDWMRETEGIPYDFEELFDGAMRVQFPLASEDALKLAKVVRLLDSAGWNVPADPDYDGSIKKFPVNKVKQKLQRLQADGGGEYEVEVDVADLRLVRFTEKVIPAGPRKGETVNKKEETTMSKAIARLVKSGQLDKDMFDWWQSKQVLYTRDSQWRQIEKAFYGEDGSEYSVVVSRHPIDVLRMSDISNIRSCHSEGSDYFHCAVAEAKGHGPIAYLVKTEDLENHLMDQRDDRNPVQQLGHDFNNLDRDVFREKVAEDFDLDSHEGRMLFLETWAHTVDGRKWLVGIEKRVEMASKPDKFRNDAYTAIGRRLGVEASAIRQYVDWWHAGRVPAVPINNTMSQPPPGVSEEDWKEAYDEVYDQPEEKDSDLKPLSDFDNQELFRDRDRSIQGIGASARVRLRKFEEPMRFGTFAVPEARIHGINVPGFADSVRKWAVAGQRDQFVDDEGDLAYPRSEDLTRRGGSYEDNKDGYLLNMFFNEMAGNEITDGSGQFDQYRNVSREDDDEDDENQQQWEEYEREIEELNEHANNTLEHCYANGMVDGDEQPYVHADGGVDYEIRLGWEDMLIQDNSIYQADKDGELVDGAVIPKSWGGDWSSRRAFESAITDPVGYYPEETEWEVVDIDDRGPILQIRHRIMCDDCTTPSEFDYFIDFMQSDVDANYRENAEKIRRSLVESEYIAPNDWDNLEDDFSEMEETLENWSVFGVGDEDGEVIFSLNPADSPKGSNKLFTGIKWPYTSGHPMGNLSTVQGLFGGKMATFGIERYVSLSPNANERGGYSSGQQGRGGMLFAQAFRGLQQAANDYAKRQLNLDFGPDYEMPEGTLIDLAKSVELGITLGTNAATYATSDDTLELAFHMRVRVLSDHTSDEIEAAFNFVKYIDANMDSLKQVTLNAFHDEVVAWAEQRKKDERAMSDGTAMKQHAKRLTLQWDDAANEGNQTAEAIMILVMWTQQNFEKMETMAERWVATDILRMHADPDVEPRHSVWDLNEDLPEAWDIKVKNKMVQLGASFSQKEAYNSNYLRGNPRPEISSDEYAASRGIDLSDREANPHDGGMYGEPEGESQLREEIYKRLQKKILKKKVKLHLTEKIQKHKEIQKQQVRELAKSKLAEIDLGYTQRTYKITFRIAMAKEHGGKREETENEMRAVPGVGTVKILPGTTRQDGGNYYADAMIKFHLLGKRSVIQYIRSELLPALRRIEGLAVVRMDRYEEITKLREWSDAYAGHGVSPGQDRQRTVPTPTIDQIAQDWMNVGTRGTANIHASSLAHSVAEVTMIPVEELMRYLGTNYFSATAKEFEEAKQQIINNGAPYPVQVAIGKNGRVKIIAGDDLVLAAKDIGLKELPTTFNLQLQV